MHQVACLLLLLRDGVDTSKVAVTSAVGCRQNGELAYLGMLVSYGGVVQCFNLSALVHEDPIHIPGDMIQPSTACRFAAPKSVICHFCDIHSSFLPTSSAVLLQVW